MHAIGYWPEISNFQMT